MTLQQGRGGAVVATVQTSASPAASRRDDASSSPGTPQIVVGHDNSASSSAALHAALSLGTTLHAHLHIVHCVTLEDYGIDPDTDEFEAVRDRHLAAERDAIAAAMKNSSVPWNYLEAHGDRVHAIAELAHSVDAAYIVVGASHRGLLRHLLDGGQLASKLVRVQPRPVIVVPEPNPT
jgi:nucleotide-binding universal stress UspA family protein